MLQLSVGLLYSDTHSCIMESECYIEADFSEDQTTVFISSPWLPEEFEAERLGHTREMSFLKWRCLQEPL